MTSEREIEALARDFHEAYERLALEFGYETREETRNFDPRSRNGQLMLAVCGELARRLQPARVPEGWVLMPRDPTPGMCKAIRMCDGINGRDAYREMLAAAPAPEAETPVPACGGDLMRCTEHSGACAVCKPEPAPQTQGEAVATVCLTPEAYAGGHMMDLQVQVAPGTTFAIGDKLYTRPAPAPGGDGGVDVEALASWCDEQSEDPDNAEGAVTLLVIAQTLRRLTSGDGGVEAMALIVDALETSQPFAHQYPEARRRHSDALQAARSLTSAQQAGTALGINFITNESVPPGEVRVMQNGKPVARIVNIDQRTGSRGENSAIRQPQADCGGEGE